MTLASIQSSQKGRTARQHGAMEFSDAPVDLDKVRGYRLQRLRTKMAEFEVAGLLLFNQINTRYAVDATNMQIWCSHYETRCVFVALDGPVVLFDFSNYPHLAEGIPTIDEYRVLPAFYFFGAGNRGQEFVKDFAVQIADLMKNHGGGNRRLAVDSLSHTGCDALRSKGLTLVEGEQKPESEVEAEVKPESEMAKPKPEMVKPEPVVETKPMSKPAPVQEESSYFTWVAVIMALIAGLLGWLWWRKRKIESVTAEESMFSSAFTSPGAEISEISQMGSTPVSDDFSYQTGNIGESSISSEFTPSDFDAFDTDQSEVDPISEADVYLAYGRYQQAEELMRQAIKDQPNRDECKLKLLEIFYANENAQEFENYANELKASGKEQDQEFWIRVVEMGSEICPSVALFNNSTEQEGSSVSNVTDVVDEPESLEPDAKSASDSVAASVSASAAASASMAALASAAALAFAFSASKISISFLLAKGMPMRVSRSNASSLVSAVVTMVISMPCVRFTLSSSISGKMA